MRLIIIICQMDRRDAFSPCRNIVVAGARRRERNVFEASGGIRRRAAFTLVELLIAMAIFVTLATIAISAWRGTDEDRVSNAAANLKNMLEGARSRAVKSNASRGVRLNLDPSDNRIVTSLVYVDGGRYETGKVIVEYDNRGTGSFSSNPSNDPLWDGGALASSKKWRVRPSDDPGFWESLWNNKLIGEGTLIEIDPGSSQWMRLQSTIQDPNNSSVTWYILTGTLGPVSSTMSGDNPERGRDKWTNTPNAAESIDGSGDSTMGLKTSIASAPIGFRIQLLPAILPNSEPVPLPRNTCIDLDGSKVPDTWRPSAAKPAYGPTTGAMDIIFSPRGNIDRPLTAEGILHFRIANVPDLLLARRNIAALQSPSSYPIVVSDPEHGAKLVSIVTQTGLVLNADVNCAHGPDANSDGVFDDYFGDTNQIFNDDEPASDPFRWVIYGKESK